MEIAFSFNSGLGRQFDEGWSQNGMWLSSNLFLDADPVQDRPGNWPAVSLHLVQAAVAKPVRQPEMAAVARIHRCHEREPGRKAVEHDAHSRAG